MTSLGIPALSGPLEVHPLWCKRWAPALTDPILRERITSDMRFMGRIFRDLTGIEVDAKGSEAADSDTLHTIERFGQEGFLRRVGLMWLAPRLVLCLMDRATRDACGRLSTVEIRDVIAFRDHIEPSRVARLPDVEGVTAQGRLCLIAWALGLASPISARLRLSLSPQDILSIDQANERAELFGGILRREEAGHL